MQLGRSGGASIEDEGTQLRQILVVVVAPALEAVDVLLGDPQRGILRVRHHGRAQVGADVEEIVLHVCENGHHVGVEFTQTQRHPDVGVRLVDGGVGVQTWIVLRGHAHVTQPGLSAVAGSRVDPRQVHHGPNITLADMVVFRVESKGPLATPLQGSTTVRGAKNSALKLMSATLLAPGKSTIANVPEILDVDVMAELLGRLGCEVTARGESPLGDSRAVAVAVPE